MCPPSPLHRTDVLATTRPSLALALRALLVACALLLAWAEFQPSLRAEAPADDARPWARHAGPDRPIAS